MQNVVDGKTQPARTTEAEVDFAPAHTVFPSGRDSFPRARPEERQRE
jgi:hypothetical protein